MTIRSPIKYFSYVLILFAVLFLVWTVSLPLALAQERQSLSVTPPFAQMSLTRSGAFKSYVKIINPNSFPLTVYVTPVNFATADEAGHPKFIPLIDEEADKGTFAGWIKVTSEPITIAPETSKEVDYTITVPEDASPGGHFAALLIGTQPPKIDGEAAALKTSQVVTALLMARVEGEVVEAGSIREFSVSHSFAGTPRADFSLRFENTGNVYLQPQGDITVFNMWGTERGYIPVNQKTNFGNVLPNSIRKFEFSWEGEPSLTDIGRYKAVASLGFGENGRQSVGRIVYFWVIPVKATLITLCVLVLFALFITFSIRLYIRHALKLAGYEERVQRSQPPLDRRSRPEPTRTVRHEARITRTVMTAPLREGVLDLRKAVRKQDGVVSEARGILGFVSEYRMFLAALCIALLGIALIVWYVLDARSANRPYEITVKNDGGATTITSEEMESARSTNELQRTKTEVKSDVAIVNASGLSGTASQVVERLKQSGYSVTDVSTDADGRDSSVIIFNAGVAREATALSELLDGMILSARPQGEETDPSILIIIGRDRAN